ncbi:hypothetical protein HPB48_021899 [Haemaphysalis longicornis]|uniref:Uncharacterized protein n=1 Tax=Haemaphysalis longicornis TaxID=44386 RepID=A0A9J6GKC8_HAELO|nr:hypothetical protein HPB48_021899 [Haemaphysalis longicornis]
MAHKRQPPTKIGQESATTTSQARIPKLDIPLFQGKLRHWTCFSEQFEQSIHNNSALAPMYKFYNLCRYVMGEAAAAIAGLQKHRFMACGFCIILKKWKRDKRRIHHPISTLRSRPSV